MNPEPILFDIVSEISA